MPSNPEAESAPLSPPLPAKLADALNADIDNNSNGTVALGDTPSNNNNSNSSSNNRKNEIKVSNDGMAKFNFSFLEDEQGESSLEPGEVKTPPHTGSEANLELVSTTPPPIARTMRSISQLEAEACEEKVRAILALDAIKRSEEAEKRKKQQQEESVKKRNSGSDEDELMKKRTKGKRKSLKKIMKEQRSARLSTPGSDNEEDRLVRKLNKHVNEMLENERLCVSPAMPAPHFGLPYAAHNFCSIRPMNPFVRHMRPDYVRGRSGSSGMPRFSNFRTACYYGNNGVVGTAVISSAANSTTSSKNELK